MIKTPGCCSVTIFGLAQVVRLLFGLLVFIGYAYRC